MYSMVTHSPRQVIQSAQAVLDRIVQDSPFHTFSQDLLGDDDILLAEHTDATSATDALVYDEQESYAIIRMYHPRYTAEMERKPRSAVLLELWTEVQRDVSYYASIASIYLSVLYKIVVTQAQSYVTQQRVGIKERLQQLGLYIAEHTARVEARLPDAAATTLYPVVEVPVTVFEPVAPPFSVVAPVVEPITSVFETVSCEKVRFAPSIEPVASSPKTLPTMTSTRTALVDLAPLLVYVRACALVVSCIMKGYPPENRITENVHPSNLTHEQYADIIDKGTHSEISRRFPHTGV